MKENPDRKKTKTKKKTGKTIDFARKSDLLTPLKKILDGEITKKSQKEFDKYLNIIRKRNKNQEQQKTLAYINILFNGRNEAINFIDDFGSMILEAKIRAPDLRRNRS